MKLKKKFQMILSSELAMARSAAVQVMKPKLFSVWEVLIPIIFILSYMRTKEQRELFAQNLLFTKKMALEAAFQIINENKNKKDVLTEIDHKTKKVLQNVENRIYSEEIRQYQMAEINLLVDHYLSLLKADGENYSVLIIRAYQTKDNYIKFTKKLKNVEKKVSSAACQTLGDKADISTLTRLESAIDSIRQKETEEIFTPNHTLDAK